MRMRLSSKYEIRILSLLLSSTPPINVSTFNNMLDDINERSIRRIINRIKLAGAIIVVKKGLGKSKGIINVIESIDYEKIELLYSASMNYKARKEINRG